jgi:hypothetical protein
VFAPKFLQFYYVKGGAAREGFYEFFFFYALQKTSPDNTTCVAELQKKYPASAIADADWLRMLKNTKEDPTGFRASDRHETIPWRTSQTISHPNDPRKGMKGPTPPRVAAAVKGIDWPGKTKSYFNSAEPQENLETAFDDWFWVQSHLQETPLSLTETKFSKLFTGHRVRVEVRRELRDSKGKPVKPDPSNNDHYGHSP